MCQLQRQQVIAHDAIYAALLEGIVAVVQVWDMTIHAQVAHVPRVVVPGISVVIVVAFGGYTNIKIVAIVAVVHRAAIVEEPAMHRIGAFKWA